MPTPWLLAVAGACALLGGAAQARSLNLSAARLHAPFVEAQGVHVAIDENGAAGALRIRADRFEAPLLGLAGRLDWSCALQREGGTRACAGPVRLTTESGVAHAAQFAARVSGERLELTLTQAGRRVALTLPFAPAEPLAASLQQIPAAWLEAPLAQVWPNGQLHSGVFDVDARRTADAHIAAQFTATGLGFDTRDGSAGADALGVNGRIDWSPAAHGGQLVVDAGFAGGALRASAWQVRLPDTRVEAGLDATLRADGAWELARFAWRDPDALEFDASGTFDPAAPVPLSTLSVHVERARLPLALARYAKDLLVAQGLDALSLKGEVTGELALDANGLQQIAFATAGLDLDDGTGHFALRGLHGRIDWAPHGARPPTTLGWKAAWVQGLPLSAASARWQARDGVLHLVGTLRTRLLGGELQLKETRLDPRWRGDELVDSTFALHGIGYDNADGSLAAAQLAADGRVRVSGHPEAPRLRLEGRLLGGEALAGAVYVKLPPTPVETALDAMLADGRWQVQRFDWRDPGVLDLAASGEFAPGAAQPLVSGRIDLRQADLAAALERYAQSWLATKGYGELAAKGTLSGALAFGREGLERFSFTARAVDLRDGAGRFAFSGVDGGAGWDLRGEVPPSTLGWRAIELFRVPLGAARAELELRRHALVLAAPLSVDVLGGQLRLEKLSLQPRSPRGERYAGSFALAGLDMGQLSAALGWPHFGGNLSGGIPEIEFTGDTIELRGGLDLYVFDGHVGVSGLTLERPFGVAPSLGADIHFENLDLDQVTSAFSFGGMSGRLMGTIKGLRLVDWSPVAFDAWLRTNGGGRMSYKAVNDITAIGGGGGLSSSLQTMALRWFDSFGYRRAGVRCKLHDEVCEMGGIDPLPPAATAADTAGYTIVEGSGVQRILIIGHRRRVDWPTLVRRLEEATQGQGPVIQ